MNNYGFKPCGHRSGASGVYHDENEPCAICERENGGIGWYVIAALVIVVVVAIVGRVG